MSTKGNVTYLQSRPWLRKRRGRTFACSDSQYQHVPCRWCWEPEDIHGSSSAYQGHHSSACTVPGRVDWVPVTGDITVIVVTAKGTYFLGQWDVFIFVEMQTCVSLRLSRKRTIDGNETRNRRIRWNWSFSASTLRNISAVIIVNVHGIRDGTSLVESDQTLFEKSLNLITYNDSDFFIFIIIDNSSRDLFGVVSGVEGTQEKFWLTGTCLR